MAKLAGRPETGEAGRSVTKGISFLKDAFTLGQAIARREREDG
jgi:hypothetical protein